MYDKQAGREVEQSTKNYLQGDSENLEVGFVDGRMEMSKLRELIAKQKQQSSLMAVQSHINKFGTNLFLSNIIFRSSTIENLVTDKRA